jgi:NADPH:quinone reductase-like Zn-dependent oxidoreductase
MRAVCVHGHGDVDVLKTVSVPEPEAGAGEVLVRVKACALNHLDVWVRKGVPGHVFPLPLVLGSDVAGVVEGLGAGVVEGLGAGVQGISQGDEVVVAPGVSCGVCKQCLSGRDHRCVSYAILGEHRDGGLAEWVVVPRANVFPKPSVCGFEEAASFGVAWLTAWEMLVERAQVGLGDTVLIQGASSGVGTACVGIAKAWGCYVMAATSRPSSLEKLKMLGADEVLLSSDPGMVAAVKALTHGEGAHVVVEHVGKPTWGLSLRCLARHGVLVTCGATGGADVSLQLQHLFFKNQTVMGSTMGSKKSFQRLLEQVQKGTLKPCVDRILSLEEVPQGHKWLESRQVFGKLVVAV